MRKITRFNDSMNNVRAECRRVGARSCTYLRFHGHATGCPAHARTRARPTAGAKDQFRAPARTHQQLLAMCLCCACSLQVPHVGTHARAIVLALTSVLTLRGLCQASEWRQNCVCPTDGNDGDDDEAANERQSCGAYVELPLPPPRSSRPHVSRSATLAGRRPQLRHLICYFASCVFVLKRALFEKSSFACCCAHLTLVSCSLACALLAQCEPQSRRVD